MSIKHIDPILISCYPTFSPPPHLKPQSVQVNGRLSACSASSGPVEADSPGRRKQYNSPIGLYSEDTLREMAAIQAGRPAGYVERKEGEEEEEERGRRFTPVSQRQSCRQTKP